MVSSRTAGRASPVVSTTAGGSKEGGRDLPTSKATNRSHSVPTVPSNTKETSVAKKKTSERRKSRGGTPSSLPSTTTRRHKERIQKQMSHSTSRTQKTVKASGNGKQSKLSSSAKTKQTKNKKKMDIMSDDDSYSASSDDSYSLSEYSSGSELDDDEYTYDSQYSDVHSYSLASDDDSESGEETDDDMPRKHRRSKRRTKKGKAAATKSKSKKSSGRKGKEKVTNSVADFLKNMENYDIPQSENQVVIRVEEHGNVEKLMLQVSRSS